MTEEKSNEYRDQRIANMKALAEAGRQPYGHAFVRSGRLSDIRRDFSEGGSVTASGRLMTVRDMGKSLFCDMRDGSDRFQIYAHRDFMGEDAFKAFKHLDIGDIIGVEGVLFTTRTGEKTIKLSSWTMLSKALLPLPEKWHGLKDTDLRYRQRYLDLIANPDARPFFERRAKAIRTIRSYLDSRGFMEVETPMIQPIAGGAAAKPFQTHYDALNAAMYLRIAPELYLKRLLVGGFEKVFELNRNFRNEGISTSHNPEFTMLEIYEAYSDVRGMKDIIQGLITTVAQAVFGGLVVGSKEYPIDLTLPWREATYRELIAGSMGQDWFSLSVPDARKRLEERGITSDPSWDMATVTHEAYEKLVEGTLIQPTFVTRFPAALIPLARACDDDPGVVDVFELVIGGREIAPAYSEMNDPLEQRRRLEHQAGHEKERIDEDFLTALEHGMPPAGGMGVGVDRLMMIFSGAEAIRDVILFPQLKPRT